MQEAQSPAVDDKGIESRLTSLGLTAPRVTRELIESKIASEVYARPVGTLTLCVLTLANGFTVVGESACADPKNFDQKIGEDLARANAVNKVWALEGYLLRQQLHDDGLERAALHDKPEFIARVAHEVNRAYCAATGDDSQPSWEDAPGWQRDSAIKGVEFHLANPDATPENSHESWLSEKIAAGWVHGEVKDAEAKTHPCIKPYADLPVAQRAKDFLFRSVVHGIARA